MVPWPGILHRPAGAHSSGASFRRGVGQNLFKDQALEGNPKEAAGELPWPRANLGTELGLLAGPRKIDCLRGISGSRRRQRRLEPDLPGEDGVWLWEVSCFRESWK